MKVNLTVTIEKETLDKLDEKRGLIARSTLIEWCVKKFLESPESDTVLGADEFKSPFAEGK
jgi:metal-responsive CopG/Arc/MetJ family transcriptional regulator